MALVQAPQLMLHDSIDIADDYDSKLLSLSRLLNNHYHDSHVFHIRMRRSVNMWLSYLLQVYSAIKMDKCCNNKYSLLPSSKAK